MRWLVIGLLGTTVASAHADELTAAFVTLERGDAGTRVGGETSLSTTSYASDPVSRTTVWRSELYGQYVHASGFGGYAKLPLSYAYYQYDQDDGGTGSLRTHNAELGALYVAERGAVRLVGQAGLVVPTLNDDLLFRYRTAFDGSRAEDALLSSASRVTALRLSTSPMWRAGRVFARADLGVDLVLASKEVEGGSQLSTVMARGGAGVGYAPTAALAVTAELAAYNVGRDGSLETVAVSCRFARATWELYGALILPLDDRRVTLAATVGAGVRL